MKHSILRSLVAASALLALGVALAPFEREGLAVTRPRYGGTLRIEMQAAAVSLVPADWEAVGAIEERIAPLLYDRLVRFDDAGRVQPALALSWQHDAEYRQWQFRLRKGVKLHDGTPLTPTVVASALGSTSTNWRVSVFGETVVIESKSPTPNLLSELASAQASIFRRNPDGTPVGTGPFRVDSWQPQRRARFVAFEDYWDGRPFLDAVELEMSRPLREQWLSLELGKADLVELSLDEVRRATQEGQRTWVSAPVELFALTFVAGRPTESDAQVREALAASIDRAALHSVLLQRQGEATGALLPQWLSGYGILFSARRERARPAAKGALQPPRRLTLVYDSADALAQRIAERVAVNAREAGISLRVTGALSPAEVVDADVRLLRVRLATPEPRGALGAVAAALFAGESFAVPASDAPESLFAAERALLESHGVIPLVHLPEAYALSPRVKRWQPERWGAWRLEDVWLESAPASSSGEVPR